MKRNKPKLTLNVANSNHHKNDPPLKQSKSKSKSPPILSLKPNNTPRKSESGLGSGSWQFKSLKSRRSLKPINELSDEERKKFKTMNRILSKRGSLKLTSKLKITAHGLYFDLASKPVANAQQIDAKFELLPLVRLGAGASGVVYSAVHIPSLRLVAVKQVPYHHQNSLNQCVQEIKSLEGNHQSCSDCVLRCAAHPNSLRHVGDMMNGKKPAHTTRRCCMCGDVFCGECKRFYMGSLGGHRWRCLDDCTYHLTKSYHQDLDTDPRTEILLERLKQLDGNTPRYIKHLDENQRMLRCKFFRKFLKSHTIGAIEKKIGKGEASHLRSLIKWDASRLSHEYCRHIVVLHDAFTDVQTSTCSIVMELMDRVRIVVIFLKSLLFYL